MSATKRPRRPNGQAAVKVYWKFDRSTIAAVQILAAADGVSPSRWAERALQAAIAQAAHEPDPTP